jgi:hypothetical protein
MPVITKPNLHFDAPIWTGVSTSSAITISSLNFQPDFVWGKNRTSAYTHGIHDSVRGTAAGRLQSNATTAEVAPGSFAYGSVSAFNSNGFTASPGSSTNENWNETGSNIVAWCWKAGGTAVTNTSGTISSQVSANPTAGFSVVTYTGTGSSTSIGHGLGAVPSVILIKSRSATTAWRMYHADLGITKYLVLSSTNSVGTASMWGTPTDTAFVVGGTTYEVNDSSATYVAYCWAPIAGYSAFGSYTGNGSTDGPFIYTGFRPKLVIIKCTSDAGQQWLMLDTSRSTYNVAQETLFPDSSGAEQLNPRLDFLSNGIKIRNTYGNQNTNGSTYVYACFAENPFKYANAR